MQTLFYSLDSVLGKPGPKSKQTAPSKPDQGDAEGKNDKLLEWIKI